MLKRTKKKVESYRRKIGIPPGSLLYMGDRTAQVTVIERIHYNEQSYERQQENEWSGLPAEGTAGRIDWINVQGLSDVKQLEMIGKDFNLHPLTLEDVLNTTLRPKVEMFNDYIFISLKMLTHHVAENSIEEEQISIVLKQGYVISFQEREGDLFDPIRLRLKESIGRIRKRDADYLFHALMDVIVDNYFLAIEFTTEKMEELEESIHEEQDEEQMELLFFMKKGIMSMRRAIIPFKESLHQLMKNHPALINRKTYSYFEDLLDHLNTVADQVEALRDMVSDIRDLYMSQINLRTNNIMMTLTIIATIFIPLTFLAGVYGMNFEYMPELEWKYSYPIIWVIFLTVAITLLLWFRRKDWL